MLAVVGLATSAAAYGGFDFGLFRNNQLDAHSEQLFGIVAPVEASSTESIDAETAAADPTRLVTLAKGLHARVVAAGDSVPPNIDMSALWPNDYSPTHLISCNEEGTGQPGLVRIRLFDGFTETIVTGTNSCDPVRRTAWGTIVFGEENGAVGWLMELMNPLGTTGVSFDNVAGTFSGGTGATNLTVRPAVGRLVVRRLALYPNGVPLLRRRTTPWNRNARRRVLQVHSDVRRGKAAPSRA
jgi:hypothetical protein